MRGNAERTMRRKSLKLHRDSTVTKPKFSSLGLTKRKSGCLPAGVISQRKRILLDVRGRMFETFENTLSNFPDTLLGNASKRQAYFDTVSGAYKLDRCVHSFDSILFYYQSNGILAKPASVSRETFYVEVSFFQIVAYIDKKHEDDVKYLAEKNEIKRHLYPMWRHENLNRFHSNSLMASIYLYTNLSVTVISVMCHCFETVPYLFPLKVWVSLEFIISAFFFVEYVLHAYFGSKEYLMSFLGAMDALTLVSGIVYLVLEYLKHHAFPFGFVKFLRVLRVCKFLKFNFSLRLFLYTLFKSTSHLSVLIIWIVVLVFSFSALVFILESHNNENSDFRTIFDAFWYTIITATGVGYGDIYPKSPLGKLFGAMIAIIGLLLFCLPQPMLVNQFISVYYLPVTLDCHNSLRKKAIIKMRATFADDL